MIGSRRDTVLVARLQSTSQHLHRLNSFHRKFSWRAILSTFSMVLSPHSGVHDPDHPSCDRELPLPPLTPLDAPRIRNRSRRRGEHLHGSSGLQPTTSARYLLFSPAAIPLFNSSGKTSTTSRVISREDSNRMCPTFAKIPAVRRMFALSATRAVVEEVDGPHYVVGPNHKDRVDAIVTEALESYLQYHKGLKHEDAKLITRNCPTFISKVVAANLPRWATNKHSKIEDVVYTEQWLMSSGANELEPFLESIGLDPARVDEVLPFMQLPLDGEEGLLRSVEILEDMGISRGTMWDVLEHKRQLLAMSPVDLRATVDFLEVLGVKRSKDMVGLIQDAFFLTDSLTTLQNLKEIGVQKHGLSKAEVARSLKLFPRLLHLRLDNLRRKIQFFDSIGLERDNVAKIIARWPMVFGQSMEKKLRPMIEMFQSLGVGGDGIAKILTRYPELRAVSLEDNLKQKVAFFEENGLRGKRLVKLMTSHPRALTLSVNELNKKLDFLVKKGFSPGSVEMVRALGACITISVESMAARFVNLESLGFSPAEGREVVKQQPAILSLSEKCIRDKVHYLVNHMHRPIEEIVKCPCYLLYSLELRIKPRHRVLSLLKSVGVLREEAYALNTIMIMSEKRFMERFVISLGAQFPQVAAAYYSRGELSSTIAATSDQ